VEGEGGGEGEGEGWRRGMVQMDSRSGVSGAGKFIQRAQERAWVGDGVVVLGKKVLKKYRRVGYGGSEWVRHERAGGQCK
jgi:hypothetical protein